MNPLCASKLEGVWATVQIPFNTDDSIDYSLLNEQLLYLSETSVHGIYSNGTAAEFYNQTEAEFDKISETMAEQCNKAGFPFQIGASHMSPVVSRERIRRTRHLRPGAYQVLFPDWLPVSVDEQIRFLSGIAEEAGPVPLVLYLPGHAKTKLTIQDLQGLSRRFPEIAGIKTGAVSPDLYPAMRELNQEIAVFVPGHHLATGIRETVGRGAYSNVACINPYAARTWYDRTLSNVKEGLKIENQLQNFFEREIMPFAAKGYSDPALDKLLAAAGGKIPVSTRLRWPYKGFGDDQVTAVRGAAKKMLPDFFDI